MKVQPFAGNSLYYGDNLSIMREYIPTASVDLVYLDPPFNSNRNFNVLFRNEKGVESEAQITAFEDTWHWNQSAEETYRDLVQMRHDASPNVARMIDSMREFIGDNQMMAYLVMMAARLVELHRVLKPTGSLYLHCDTTVSHYMKIILDTIFDPKNFRSEVIWRRTYAHNDPKNYGNVTDSVLYYSKSGSFTWTRQYKPYSSEYISGYYRYLDEQGRRYRLVSLRSPQPRPNLRYDYKGYKPHPNGWAVSLAKMQQLDAEGRLHFPKKADGAILEKMYLEEMPGVPLQNLWDDIGPIGAHALERLGYPTQKPLALLERIIQASSNPGDIVLDPFAGCGTTVAAAQKLGRTWVGIDITHLSITLLKYRLNAMFPGIQFRVKGEPEDIGAAQQLANDDRYQFQWWALSLVHAKPLGGQDGSREGKKGADKGVDGAINFLDDSTGKPKSVIVQVKSGHVKRGDIATLKGDVEREKASIGVFITLEPPTKDMTSEAIAAGYYHSPAWGKDFPRIQILTIAELLHGAEVKMPPEFGTFKQAQKVQHEAIQAGLGLDDM